MASTENELIDEARALTNYGPDIISDGKFQELVDVAKEELYAELGDTNFSFFGQDTQNADRALFWLVCLFSKVRTGEIDGIDLSIGDLRAESLSGDDAIWRRQFVRRLNSISGASGFGRVDVARDNRTYGS